MKLRRIGFGRFRFGCIKLRRIEFGRVHLRRVRLRWIGFGWIGFGWIGFGRFRRQWNRLGARFHILQRHHSRHFLRQRNRRRQRQLRADQRAGHRLRRPLWIIGRDPHSDQLPIRRHGNGNRAADQVQRPPRRPRRQHQHRRNASRPAPGRDADRRRRIASRPARRNAGIVGTPAA